MKIETLARPGLVALGVVGIATTALLGFAAGVAVSRDPKAVRRTARRVAGAAAVALERATLLAAQAREHVGDLWAQARDAAVADVDDADFERTAAGASNASRAAAAVDADAAPAKKAVRKRATRARKARTARPSSSKVKSNEITDQA